jgi:hypothetical protein
MSGGTLEFCVVDAENLTVHVTDFVGTKVCVAGDSIPLAIFVSDITTRLASITAESGGPSGAGRSADRP